MTDYDTLYLFFMAMVFGSLLGLIWATLLYWTKF